MAKTRAKPGRSGREAEGRGAKSRTARIPRTKRNVAGQKNKIHVSLFVDGQDVTLIEEFDTPAAAIAACREFLDEHAPKSDPRRDAEP